MKNIVLLVGLLSLVGCKQLDLLKTNNAAETNKQPVKNEFLATEIDPNEDIFYYDVALPEAYVNQLQNPELTKPVFGNIWQRIQSQLTFDIPNNRRIAIQKSWYARHPDYLERVAKRAEPFLYLIVEEIEKRGLPMELVLLPIVESAFDPFAYSHGSASGLWQFVPDTGERFGLKQNWWYDGRRDVLAATHAALDYLTFLNKEFDGDWLHALAAYNSGEGRVARAIKKNYKNGENVDYWSLELPRETDAYVPKLLALADIMRRPHDFKMRMYPIANVSVLEQVNAPSQIDLAKAAKLADMDVNELHALNPGYNRWATAPDGPHTFLLPIEKAEAFNNAIKNIEPKALVAWQRYKIKSGDSLGKIAKQHNVTIESIRTANNLKGNMIRVGKHLLIPVAAKSEDSYDFTVDQRLAKTQTNDQGKAKAEHIVKSGDTFWDISRKHKVNVRELAKWNNMAPGDPIFPGQKLVVWKTAPSDNQLLGEAPTVKKVKYKVRSGDSLARIANKFNVTISDIENWNKLSRKNYLQPGQLLQLYVDVTRI
ncbi:lytic transglycosylase [Saccharobesus litoralis]|uniref:Lytic transglycosylase n=1 Tax=Saccharobesus litoralis TaxID=2172099 RepID=A0A2S0VUF2_9ALTE|nr:LysM peptidoglycan-binding domain-containing protein [Saccharobesus litoralis]AWB67839.1 lytic transglycosylase [Saccharobesus litoralis]